MNLRRVLSLVALLLLAFAATVSAAAIDQIAKDFKPLSGYVVMPVQGEFLIDQDASKGVSVGDLFSVVKPGEKVVHPVTKAVIGSLDEMKGLLQVTRVKSGYSYARPLGDAKGIERGDVVRRFENLDATFWDYTGAGEAVLSDLKKAIPNLQWPEYAAAQTSRPQVPAAPAKGGAALYFILRHDGLEVRDASFQTLHAYPLAVAGAGQPPLPKAAAAPPAAATSAIPGSLEERLLALEQQQARLLEGQQGAAAGGAPYVLDAKQMASSGSGYQVTFAANFKNLGELAGITRMADFVRSGGKTLLAATDGRTIRVYTVGETLTPLIDGQTAHISQVLGLHWWQPEASGPLYLAATGWDGRGVEGVVFALQGEQLVVVKGGKVPYILGSFDRDGDGRKELLLGQSFDQADFFGKTVREVQFRKGELKTEKVGFKLPSRFTVQGGLMADVTGDGTAETIVVRDGLLRIFADEKEIYRSPKQMGGTLSVALYETNPGAKDSLPGAVEFEVPPVAADLDGDGKNELLAVASDRPFMTAPGVSPGVRKSWLAVVKFRENMFVKGTLGAELEVPLQGLAMEEGRVLFVASEPGSILGEGGGSHLLAFPLAK